MDSIAGSLRKGLELYEETRAFYLNMHRIPSMSDSGACMRRFKKLPLTYLVEMLLICMIVFDKGLTCNFHLRVFYIVITNDMEEISFLYYF